ncbi:glutaredoxin family protein [Dehalococcoides mccartyi]|jgi:glutaredoxin|uniref:Glutaredoxin protein n=2 Tax=Dehalococcoides mccartyi TaxID=61435 RepID=A0A142V877_9CHLR|nr:glutaredoxin family protein [Dehalococcoides mccartyi]AII60396.1 glutaredoxin [Dehalococcoides mccartyi CG5]AMU86036.1 glutaredoxin protein [Dehalococcoides mccartyi]AOV98845.1 glutaredoxin family protein [Dehalococcoides mccartyi]MBA2084604.1 Glutaredoxin protein [Dehalococcoides mccartyi]QBX63383.1 glutaredoxin family protein [Dehalococcoides mccartyi]
MEKIIGRNAGKIKLYALSTCGWCRLTRQLLAELGVAYEFEYVDLLTGAEREKAVKELTALNPSSSFPTMVIGENRVIIGYKKAEIREALKA